MNLGRQKCLVSFHLKNWLVIFNFRERKSVSHHFFHDLKATLISSCDLQICLHINAKIIVSVSFTIMKLSRAFLLVCVYLPLAFGGILKNYNVEKGCGKSD